MSVQQLLTYARAEGWSDRVKRGYNELTPTLRAIFKNQMELRSTLFA